MEYTLSFTVNGEARTLIVRPFESLNSVLRERLHLRGTKRACDTGGCGSCTVIVDGRAVYSCMMPALKAAGKSVTTIEGLAANRLDPLQDAFIEFGALQCGFCTPGLIMAARALLHERPDATAEEIRDALVGNLCRCTGYTKILQAVAAAAHRERQRRS